MVLISPSWHAVPHRVEELARTLQPGRNSDILQSYMAEPNRPRGCDPLRRGGLSEQRTPGAAAIVPQTTRRGLLINNQRISAG